MNGWIKTDIMLEILNQIYQRSHGLNSVLVLDRFPTHITDVVKRHAKKKKIILLFVPEGLTHKYQPLDYSINGILKMKLQMKYTEFITKNNSKYTLNKFLTDFSTSIASINKETIINSFDCLKIIKPV